MKKKNTIILIVGVVVLIVFWFVGKYNGLVGKKGIVDSKWSQIENVYQSRADLIPNLVATVKGYAEQEQQVMTDVIDARTKATSLNFNADNLTEENIKSFQAAQDMLSETLSRLFVTAEKHPDLKANQNFMELQAQLEETENRIAVERKNFNDAVKDYNTNIRIFPTNVIANIFGFNEKACLESAE